MQLREKYAIKVGVFVSICKGIFFQLLFVFIFYGTVLCQSFEDFQQTDDLEEKILIAYFLGAVYGAKDIDSLKIVGDLLIIQAKLDNSVKAKNYANQLLGTYYTKVGEVYKGLNYLRDSRNYFAEIKDLNMVTDLSNRIGVGYQSMGKFEKAVQWYHESLLYGFSSSDDKNRNLAKINLALAYAELGEFKTAERLATEFRDWAYEIKSKTAIANSYACIGKICMMERYHDIAIGNFELSMSYARKSTSITQLAHGYTNIGIVKFLEGNKDECVPYFKNALRLHLKVKTLNFILDAYLNLGGAYFEIRDLENAKVNYQKGLDLALKNNKYDSQVEFLNALIEMNELERRDSNELKVERDKADAQHKAFLARVTKIDQLLDGDLKKKRPDNLILSNRTKEFSDSIVVPLFIFFVVVILGQLFLKKLV